MYINVPSIYKVLCCENFNILNYILNYGYINHILNYG